MPFPWSRSQNNNLDDPESEKLARASYDLFSASDPVDLCHKLTEYLRELAGAERVWVLLWDATRGLFSLVMKDGQLSEDPVVEGDDLLKGPLQQVFRQNDIVAQPGEGGRSSQITLPLRTQDKTVGVVDLGAGANTGAFTSHHTAMAHFLVSQAAIMIETVRMDQAEKSRRQMYDALIQAGRKLSGTLTPFEVPLRILEQLAVVVPYERGSLFLKDGDAVRVVAQRGFPQDERTQRLRIPLREGDVFFQISTTGRPILVDDVTQDPGWQQVTWLPLNLSWLGVPLYQRDAVIGMLSLTRKDKAAFSQDDVLMASTFALQAVAALDNAALYEEITRFNQQLEQMVQQRTEELQRALQALERMDKNKTDFISVAAHELRTPLTIMKGYLTMMQGDPAIKANEYLLSSLDGILKGTDRLYEIVNSMLDVIRIDSQVLDVRLEMVALGSIAKRIRSDYASDLQQRNLTFNIDGLEGLPVIHADGTLLLKAFQNVVLNAIKYTPDGGCITVSGTRVKDEKMGDAVELLFSDTGIGIDPEHQDLIFEKFYRTGEVALHSSGKTSFKGGGPGLGLSIARGVVLAHGGRIWVESAGQDEQALPGCCFHMLLPVNKDAVLAPKDWRS